MKQLASMLLVGAALAFAGCGGDDPPAPEAGSENAAILAEAENIQKIADAFGGRMEAEGFTQDPDDASIWRADFDGTFCRMHVLRSDQIFTYSGAGEDVLTDESGRVGIRTIGQELPCVQAAARALDGFSVSEILQGEPEPGSPLDLERRAQEEG